MSHNSDPRQPRGPDDERDERDERRKGDPRDPRDPRLPNNHAGILPRRWLDLFFIFQVVINILVLGALTAAMIYVLGQVAVQSTRQEALTQAQIEFIRDQNTVQICAQHDITLAVQKLARGFERVLGLPPIAQIDVPSVESLGCENLLEEVIQP